MKELTNNIISILLQDRTTNKNIIWATDSYHHLGERFSPKQEIGIESVNDNLIEPRATKNKTEQSSRTKKRAEVFTPLSIVKQMNDDSDPIKEVTKNNWQEYINLTKLEITCGEAPYIVSRYDPISDSCEILPLDERVGFLDKKLKTITTFCDNEKDWAEWARIAFKRSYGFEWQGDSLFIARQNLLFSFVDYYQDKFSKSPSLELQEEIAEIISWNIFQMDGLKYVIPMSCSGASEASGSLEDSPIQEPCKGCKNKTTEHDGIFVKVMDWESDKIVNFVDIINS